MSEIRIAANGIELACEIDGPPGAPWVTLCHSLATSRRLWEAQLRALASRYRVLRFDARGHGASDAPEGPYGWDMLVRDVVALWDALGVERSHVVGLSMGGMTGMGLALGHGERLASLACCDCRADAPAFFRDMWDARQGRVREGGMEAVLEQTLATWFTEAAREALGDRLAEVEDMILGTSVTGYLGATDALKSLDFKRSLPSIGTRTLFLVGAEDGPHPGEMREMSELVPGSTYRVVERAGHLSSWEQPDVFNEHLIAFLADGD